MLTFIPTPIGNLSDISYRSIDFLKEADIFLCEDTRVTKKLLNLISNKFDFQINFNQKTFISVHSHNEKDFIESANTLELLQTQNIVYLSDAGMPCISDPGALIVDFCIKNNIPYDILPGANAVLTAYAMSGFTLNEFNFIGFLPHKSKDRINKLENILQNSSITILYESPHRLIKMLNELQQLDPNRIVFIAKELTKKYQQTFKDSAKNIYEVLSTNTIKGEWVVVIDAKPTSKGEAITYSDIEKLDIAPKQKAKLLSKLTGENTKDIYARLSI